MAHSANSPGRAIPRDAWSYEAVDPADDDQESASSSSDLNERGAKHESNQTDVEIEQQCDESISPCSRTKLHFRRRRMQGWRFGVATSAIMTTTVLLINTILTIWASIHYGLKDGIGTAYTGNCALVSSWSLGLHLLVNALSSALFGASNYTMQCLMAPTRQECDSAHARGDWLDIGVSSFRNLIRISGRRQLGWVLLALSSLPIHFLYNSAVFKELDHIQSVQFVQGTAGILRSDELDLGVFPKQIPASLNDTALMGMGSQRLLNWYNGPVVSQLRDLYLQDPATFDRLEPQQCVDIYGGDLLSGYSHAFAIVDPTVQVNISSGTRVPRHPPFRSWTVLGLPEAADEALPLYWPSAISDIGYYTQRDSSGQAWLLKGMYLDHCVVKKEEPHCKLQFSMYILVIIIVCNIMKAVIMLWHLWHQGSETFVTFGDALASWLDEPDEHTKGNCLIEAKHVRAKAEEHAQQLASQPRQGVLVRRTQPQPPLLEVTAREAPSKRRRWAAAVDTKQWLLSLTLCVASLSTAAIFLIIGNSDGDLVGIKEAISTGKLFVADTTSTLTTTLPTNGAKGLLASVLLVNTPQIILSCCYLAYNGLVTGMHLAYEYSGYAVRRKGLRVTDPQGEQRCTYWLQLPYKYGLPLLIATSILHWLISQSLFLVRVARYRADLATNTLKAVTDSTARESGVGASLMPILVGIFLASCMLFAVIGLRFRKLASNMPIVGSCSFALAAAAHRPEEDEKASVLPLMWGEIPRMRIQELGHCSFTSEEVVDLQPKRKYA